MTDEPDLTNKPLGRLVDAVSDFQIQTALPGGISREKALSSARRTLRVAEPKIGKRYLFAMQELDRISTLFLTQDMPTSDILNEALGICSELRNSAALVHFPLVTAVASTLCSMIVAFDKEGVPYRQDAIKCFMDAIRLVAGDDYRDVNVDDAQELVVGLKQVEASVMPKNMRCAW